MSKDNGKPYSVGSNHWTGLSKLIEEAGEVIQVCGKILATGGEDKHWDGTDLRKRLEEELADLLAAAQFVQEKNNLNTERTEVLKQCKLVTYDEWHESGQ